MFDDLKQRINDLSERFSTCGDIFDLAAKEEEKARLEQEMLQEDFWQRGKDAQEVLKRRATLQEEITRWQKLQESLEEARLLLSLAEEEEDTSVLPELEAAVQELEEQLARQELQTMLSGENDQSNAILSIHPGAGGTESQDWAEMLLRMYLRWAERRGYTSEVLDFQAGEEAGIKSVTVLIKGKYAYGYLKAETGVHRLVRISPFDASNRRHTSFASVFVSPELDDTIQVEINEADLRIDTFRASGAGGQHVNVTDSAVRITHLPTGIVVQCQNERSQHKNKAAAMKILRSRLYALEKRKQEEKLEELHSGKKEIGWGSQIRSYILHPYQLVKDHRTDKEIGNVQAVLDGDIDPFIEAYLLLQRAQKRS
ncbi:MAG: peptide chain release factor 2 [Nitrospinota bacterium]|nr:MAG: peptide chain release factor 2 [Nitrospinota bacterium]